MKAQELSARSLLEGTKVFTVPIFQRRYSWKREQWAALWGDIEEQFASAIAGSGASSGGHFLGSVVLHPDSERSSTVSQYLVIDGQQRLTTLMILIAALRDSRKLHDPEWAQSDFASEYDHQYLRNAYSAKSPDKLLPTQFDREPYLATVYKGEPVGTIGQAYVWFQSAIDELRRETAGFDYDALADAILSRLTFVEIRTDESDSVNSIFNTLNSKGLPLSAVDLIRNEYMWALGSEADQAYADLWAPMEKRLEGDGADTYMLNYLWAQTIRRDPKVTQRDLFEPFAKYIAALQEQGGRASVHESLTFLHEEHYLYAALNIDDRREGLASRLSDELQNRVDSMYWWGSSPHVPLTLDVMSRVARRVDSGESGERALEALLSFLVRRALAGLPSNNLNRMLTAGPASFGSGAPIDRQLATFLHRFERAWPNDADLLIAGETAPIYATLKRSQVHFILRSLRDSIYYTPKDRSRVAHIIPTRADERWDAFLREQGSSLDVATALVNTLGNLVLVTVPTTRIPLEPRDRIEWILENAQGPEMEGVRGGFLVEEIRGRSRRLMTRALSIWPRAEDFEVRQKVTGPEIPTAAERLFNVLMSIRDGEWTTDSALAAALGETEDEIRALVAQTGPESARFVLDRSGSVPAWMPSGLREQVTRQNEVLNIGPLAEAPLDSEALAALITSDADSDTGGWEDED